MSDHTLRLGETELFVCEAGTPAIDAAMRIETDCEANGGKRVFLVRRVRSAKQNTNSEVVRYCIFYRLESSEEERIFSSTQGIYPLKNRRSTLFWWRRKVELSIHKVLNRGLATRLWRPKNAPFYLELNSHGHGELIQHEEHQTGWPIDLFHWGNLIHKSQFLDWPDVDFNAFCENFYADENSDFNYLMRWRKLSHEEKMKIAFSCKNGDWAQLHHLATLVLRLATGVSGVYPVEWKMEKSYWDFARPIPAQYDSPATRFLRPWATLLCDTLQPKFWCDYRWCEHRFRCSQKDSPDIRISRWEAVHCESPTEQELVKIRRELRAWLRGKVPEDEICTFLLEA